MKLISVLRLLQETCTAIAFAEANEHETALTILGTKGEGKSISSACPISKEECLCTLSSAA